VDDCFQPVFVWEYQTVAALAELELGYVWFKPFFDPRESLLFSGLHFLCPYLEVNRFGSSLGVVRRFVVVDAAI